MTDYRILEETDRHQLEKLVKSLVELGWYPQGGVCAYPAGLRTFYLQTMCK